MKDKAYAQFYIYDAGECTYSFGIMYVPVKLHRLTLIFPTRIAGGVVDGTCLDREAVVMVP